MPSSVSSDTPSSGERATSEGAPTVRVPVLSKAMDFTLPRASRYAPPLMTTPPRAAAETAERTAEGVAIASAQGEAATSSETPRRTACTHGIPVAIRTTGTSTAMPSTTGTKRFSMRMARRCVALLCASAWATMSTIFASTLSRESRVTSISSDASVHSVPANTASPGPRATGTDSPVIVA